VRTVFGVLGAALAFAWTLPHVDHYAPIALMLIWVGSFLGVRVLLYAAFARLTRHRGIWHSLLAALFAALVAVNLLHWTLGQAPGLSWAGGLMVGIGYLTHLVLDEAFGVDLLGVRVKRSFGTALKPWSLKDPAASLMLAAATALLVWLAPPAHRIQEALSDPNGWWGPIAETLVRAARDLAELPLSCAGP
jgi:membrane-bound metal-dependent hydrolase YbcI (DUF457 family)